MMSFEDIVDMDWLDSHSIKGEPMDLFPNDFVDLNHYLSPDLLSPKLEHSSPPPLLLPSSPSSNVLLNPAASCSAAAALAAATTTPPPPLTFPTTEQIKQLIELAKHQLALRGQSTSSNCNSDTSVSSTDQPSTSTAATSTPTTPESSSTTSNATSSSANNTHVNTTPCTNNTSSLLDSTASTSTPNHHPLAHLDANLFSASDLPDTVSPESLMKPISTLNSNTSKLPSTKPSKTKLSKTNHKANTASTLSPTAASPTTTNTNVTSAVAAASSDTTNITDLSMEDIASDEMKSTRRESLTDEVSTLEAYAETDGIDIKKLTPKERRQLRNKISARNFRVRRKEYITALEQQVSDHKKHAEVLVEKLDKAENENKQLRQEVDSLKRQNLLLQQQQQLLQQQA